MGFAAASSHRLPLFLTDADVEKLAHWPTAIAAIRSAYADSMKGQPTPGRIFAQTADEWIRIMPSIPASGRLFGSKSIAGSFHDGLTVSYLISLFDKRTAELVALVDGNRVTGLRTAATTAVAAALIAPRRALVVGVIGSGFEARSHLSALSHELAFSDIRIFSPTPGNREELAADVLASGTSARAVDSAHEAVAGADLVLCAARSRDESPTVRSEWVAENAAIISIGSTTPAQRELPIELIGRAALIVADSVEEVMHGSGDMIAARESGLDIASVTVSLASAVGAGKPLPSEGIRIYKSTGSGLQDVVVAEALYESARSAGVGTLLPVGIVTNRK
ncbi:hypothetical protein [uncultured Microbacterium sp.]|uniref:ornithine cyclodeaminase family protein n=1 Tax=uncultured Microbacterium sp. TaxID=191216 RepID=UPI0028D626CF|nr:hypothetical protein [uncultured Microbacterium sp.]